MRRMLATVVVLAGLWAAPAAAETEMPGIGPGTRLGGALPVQTPGTGGGQNGVAAPPVAAAPAAPVKQRTVRRCRRRGRTTTCTSYRGAVAKRYRYRVCTQRRGHRRRCRAIRSAATRSAPSPVMARALDLMRRRAAHSGSYGQGTLAQAMPAVVRIYWQVPVRRQDGTTVMSNSYCSGSVLLTGVILTAGHCVFANGADGEGQPRGYYDLSTYTIVPGNTLQNGQPAGPYGQWKVRNMWTTADYGDNDRLGADWGLIEVAPDAAGRYPGQVVGTVSATWNQALGSAARLYNVGYSYNGPFKTAQYGFGNQQRYCDSYVQSGIDIIAPYKFTYGAANGGNYYGIDMKPCWQTGGSSGGPVFYYGPQGWTVIGVNNRGGSGSDEFGTNMITFWFDDDFGRFYGETVAKIDAGQ